MEFSKKIKIVGVGGFINLFIIYIYWEVRWGEERDRWGSGRDGNYQLLLTVPFGVRLVSRHRRTFLSAALFSASLCFFPFSWKKIKYIYLYNPFFFSFIKSKNYRWLNWVLCFHIFNFQLYIHIYIYIYVFSNWVFLVTFIC